MLKLGKRLKDMATSGVKKKILEDNASNSQVLGQSTNPAKIEIKEESLANVDLPFQSPSSAKRKKTIPSTSVGSERLESLRSAKIKTGLYGSSKTHSISAALSAEKEQQDGSMTLSQHQHIKSDTSSKDLLHLKEEEVNEAKSIASTCRTVVGTLLGLEKTEGPNVVMDEEVVTKSYYCKSSTYNFKSVEKHLHRLCEKCGVRNALIFGEKRLEKFTLVGENTSSLEQLIKNDDDMKKINLTIIEHKGKQFQLLTLIVVSGSWVKCELLLRGLNSDDHFAVIPAHLFVSDDLFDQEERFIADTLPFSFQHPYVESYITREVPKFLFRHKIISDLNLVLDIAAVKVNQDFVIRSSGRYCPHPIILQVTKSQLEMMANENVKIYLSKGGPTGYVMQSSGKNVEGHFCVKFPSEVLVNGDCGTIMYVKDSKTRVKYMLGMLRLGNLFRPEIVYGATVLCYNIDELAKAMRIDLVSLKNQVAMIPCYEQLLQSLKKTSL